MSAFASARRRADGYGFPVGWALIVIANWAVVTFIFGVYLGHLLTQRQPGEG